MRDKAVARPERSIMAWLRNIGILPAGLMAWKTNKNPVAELDPSSIRVGYLAEVAYEWDTWGPSSPTQFVNALACECKGVNQHDRLVALLESLAPEAPHVQAA